MKKITLVLFFMFITYGGFSQVTYFHYLDYTSVWKYYRGGWNGINAYDIYTTNYFDGDETINGQAYYKQYGISVYTNYNTMQGTYSETFYGGPYYIREDESGKFLQYLPDTNSEIIMFDSAPIANAQPGDPFPYSGATCEVQNIETVYLGTMPLKKVYGINTGANTGSVEGIGDIGLACATSIESDGGIACYTKQGNTIQFRSIDCNAFPTAQPLGVHPINPVSKTVIYPNPSDGILNIKLNAGLSQASLTISNVYGAIAKKSTIQSNETAIDISSFAAGIYFVHITGVNIDEVKKIIKQ